jgi:hypothetical protein
VEQQNKFSYGRAPAQPWSARQRCWDPELPSNSGYSLLISRHNLFPLKCALCGFATGNDIEFEITYGPADERLLRICRFCLSDLELLGFRFNQVIHVYSQPKPKVRQIPIILETADLPMVPAICCAEVD